MTIHRFATFLLCTLAVVGCGSRHPITLVTVRDRDFAVVGTLAREHELESFVGAWESKMEIEPSFEPSWTYTIDVRRSSSDSERWRYDPAGWTCLLAIKV